MTKPKYSEFCNDDRWIAVVLPNKHIYTDAFPFPQEMTIDHYSKLSKLKLIKYKIFKTDHFGWLTINTNINVMISKEFMENLDELINSELSYFFNSYSTMDKFVKDVRMGFEGSLSLHIELENAGNIQIMINKKIEIYPINGIDVKLQYSGLDKDDRKIYISCKFTY